jgi:hypothetical protein
VEHAAGRHRRAAAAAALSDFSNAATMATIRQAAVLRTSAGTLPLGMPVTDAHIRIDYLSLTRNADKSLSMTAIRLPACRHARCGRISTALPIPMAPVASASCVHGCARQGRRNALMCVPAAVPVDRPHPHDAAGTTIVKAESLGYQAGSALCP